MIRDLALPLSIAALFAAMPVSAGDLLVGNKSADTVWRLSTKDGSRIGQFATGQGPHEIVVSDDNRFALVSNYGAATPGRSITVLDLRKPGGTRTLDLGDNGRPHGMRLLPGGNRIVVTTEASRKLLLVDVASGRVEHEIDLGEGRGHMVAVSRDGNTAFVTKIDAGTVSRVDLAARTKTHEVPAGAGAEGVAVHPASGEVWVSNREAGTVTVHDPKTLAIRRTIASEGFPIRVVFTSDGRHALVTNARAATLSVIDTNKYAVAHTVALSRPGVEYRETMLGRAALPIGVIADPKLPRVYAAVSGGDELAVIDTEQWKVIDHWKTGREPDALGIVE
ncbi:YncE family protein [Lysobacter arvi]|uniref:Cytochrome D1 domain-containing protein n=1 Tax=Lysobacter arvi TaxID=3038776 RepID=A0ABU1CBD0_9GAMM|nr:cytochrome D1 domain-containing protein [Lysobacter arvi]MDR0181357.1 cytochrome D1 domain-containing protein [Lysobacter arvi]